MPLFNLFIRLKIDRIFRGGVPISGLQIRKIMRISNFFLVVKFTLFFWFIENFKKIYLLTIFFNKFKRYCIPGKYKAQFEELIKKEK